MTVIALVLAMAAAAAPQESAPSAAAAPFGPPWTALIGEWVGEGDGVPGAGVGAASFALDLEGRVLVRRTRSDYPAAGGRPAVHHEDLMVVYPAGPERAARAVYFDNEGHVIEYAATWSADAVALTLASSPGPGEPGFRLTYRFLAPDRVEVSFEVAPPGSGAFRRYVSGVMRRSAEVR